MESDVTICFGFEIFIISSPSPPTYNLSKIQPDNRSVSIKNISNPQQIVAPLGIISQLRDNGLTRTMENGVTICFRFEIFLISFPP